MGAGYTQPCETPVDFRAEQCAQYNGQLYNGQAAIWAPHIEAENPCALTCITQNGDIVTLNSRVQDGTRCTGASLDMCINGLCQKVGCDLRIGSDLTVDSCGVCGGDDTTCSGAGPAYYYWSVVQAAACSRPCGGGVRRPELKCRNRVTEEEVKHELCKVETKPRVVDEACNTQPCVARWVAEPWGLCSVPCGKGIRSRKYYCAQDIDGVQTRVSHHHCTKQHKPKTQEPCFIQACPPKWITQKWSPCSAQCGEGIQMRNVSCNEGRPDADCAHLEKPADVRTCSSDVQCDWNGRTLELEYRFHNYSTAEKLVGKLSPSDPTWSPDEWSDCSAPCGPGVRRRKVKCKIFLEFSKTFATLPDGECRGARPMIEEKCMVEPCVAKNRWVTEPWSNCSVPCGEGFKTRSVLCKTYLENARVLATVPDSQCEEVKPVDRQRCVMPLCALEHKLEAAAFQDEEIKVVSGSKGAFTYSWRSDDYTQCSKSCLQGVQETIVMCIRDQDSRSVHPGLCDPKTKPEVLYRTCNDFSCPPRWQTGEFQPCSKKCGLGIQLREVQCIHEVVRNSTSVVPNIQCPQPPPPDRQYCAVVDCEIQWHTDKWSKCSRPCGGGIKTRKVECKQEMAQRHIVNRLPEQCPKHRPVDKRPCNTKPCASEISRPFIAIDNTTFIQHDPDQVKVHLKVGNHATVYYNTQLKIKCPVHQFDRSKIKWIKDGQIIRRGKNYKISKKGALKIVRVTFQDDGVFTCKAGQSGADITIAVKPKSGVFINSEELPHGDGSPADPALIEPGKSPLRYDPEDSHEKNPTGVRKSTSAPYQERKRKPSVVGRGTTTPTPTQDWDNRTNGHNASSDTPEGPAKSGAARLLPTFRSLLSHLQVYAGVRGHDAHLTDDNKPDAAWHEPARPAERDDVNAARKMSGEELRHDEKGGEATRDQETKRQETNGREIIPETSGREIKHETSEQEIKFREIIGQESSRETSGQEPSWFGQNENERMRENDSRMSSSNNDLKNDSTNRPFTKNPSMNNSATKDGPKKETIKHGFANNAGKHERKTKKSAKNGTRTGVKRHRNQTRDDELRGQGHQNRQGNQNLTSNSKDPNNENDLSRDIIEGTNGAPSQNNHRSYQHRNTLLGQVDNTVEEKQDGGIQNGGETQDGGSIHHFQNGDGSHNHNQDGGDVHLLDSEDGILPLPLFPLALAQTDQRFGSDDEEMGEEFILGKGSRQNLKFEWAVTDWSKCSQPCGGNGYRMRAAHCMAVLHNRTRNVDAALCIDAGLTAVPVIEACGARYCPVWKTGLWEACDAAQCFTWNTAMQTRTIWCEAENGTHLNGSYCEHDITPVTRQECYNDLCKGVWRVGEWSDCSAPCEGDGMKYRILQCVWYGTRRPAGNACRDQTRPSVMKICRGSPCTANNAKCEDRSRYCRNVRKMNLCKLERYQKECCSSCKQSTL